MATRLLAATTWLVGTSGCSSLVQASGAGVIGSERGAPLAGGGVSGHVGLGPRMPESEDETNPVVDVPTPFAVDAMLRLTATNRFVSFGAGGGYLLVAEVARRHTGFARALGVLACNAGSALLCGGGARAEVGVGLTVDETRRVNPGLFVEDEWRSRTLLTFTLFGEYTGTFSRPTAIPMLGFEVGCAWQDGLVDVSRGRVLK